VLYLKTLFTRYGSRAVRKFTSWVLRNAAGIASIRSISLWAVMWSCDLSGNIAMIYVFFCVPLPLPFRVEVADYVLYKAILSFRRR
jgi:hypothetical protein